MTAGRMSAVTQPEAALAEELGRKPFELEYAEDGRLVDFIDSSTLLQDRKEERRRQQYLRILHYEYGYPKEQMRREFPINIGSTTPISADIAVFRSTTSARAGDQGRSGFALKSRQTMKLTAIISWFPTSSSHRPKGQFGPTRRQSSTIAGLMNRSTTWLSGMEYLRLLKGGMP